MENCKCKQCGYFWVSYKENPKQCPRCKRYDWNMKNKAKLKEEKSK